MLIDRVSKVAGFFGFQITPAGVFLDPMGVVSYVHGSAQDQFDVADPRVRLNLDLHLAGPTPHPVRRTLNLGAVRRHDKPAWLERFIRDREPRTVDPRRSSVELIGPTVQHASLKVNGHERTYRAGGQPGHDGSLSSRTDKMSIARANSAPSARTTSLAPNRRSRSRSMNVKASLVEIASPINADPASAARIPNPTKPTRIKATPASTPT